MLSPDPSLPAARAGFAPPQSARSNRRSESASKPLLQKPFLPRPEQPWRDSGSASPAPFPKQVFGSASDSSSSRGEDGNTRPVRPRSQRGRVAAAPLSRRIGQVSLRSRPPAPPPHGRRRRSEPGLFVSRSGVPLRHSAAYARTLHSQECLRRIADDLRIVDLKSGLLAQLLRR